MHRPNLRTLDLKSLPRDDGPPSETQLRRQKYQFFEKQCSEIAPGLFLAGDWVARNRELLASHGVTHVVNCVGFVCQEYFKGELDYRTYFLQDTPAEDILCVLYDAFEYIDSALRSGGRVLVHCSQGVSRSATIVIAFLMWREGASYDDIFARVKAIRGVANPNIGFTCQLLQWQKRRNAPPARTRMYRIIPHSQHAPLLLVPRSVTPPKKYANHTWRELDRRGAFIIQTPSRLYVWVGEACPETQARAARDLAHLVPKYETSGCQDVNVYTQGNESAEFLALMDPPALDPDAELQNARRASITGDLVGTLSFGPSSFGSAAPSPSPAAAAIPQPAVSPPQAHWSKQQQPLPAQDGDGVQPMDIGGDSGPPAAFAPPPRLSLAHTQGPAASAPPSLCTGPDGGGGYDAGDGPVPMSTTGTTALQEFLPPFSMPVSPSVSPHTPAAPQAIEGVLGGAFGSPAQLPTADGSPAEANSTSQHLVHRWAAAEVDEYTPDFVLHAEATRAAIAVAQSNPNCASLLNTRSSDTLLPGTTPLLPASLSLLHGTPAADTPLLPASLASAGASSTPALAFLHSASDLPLLERVSTADHASSSSATLPLTLAWGTVPGSAPHGERSAVRHDGRLSLTGAPQREARHGTMMHGLGPSWTISEGHPLAHPAGSHSQGAASARQEELQHGALLPLSAQAGYMPTAPWAGAGAPEEAGGLQGSAAAAARALGPHVHAQLRPDSPASSEGRFRKLTKRGVAANGDADARTRFMDANASARTIQSLHESLDND